MLLKNEEKDGKIKTLYDSSNILASTFDTLTRDLIIIFKAGTQYKYTGVSKADFMRFQLAESQGIIFNTHIKKYSTTKLDSLDPALILLEAVRLKSAEQRALLDGKKSKIIKLMKSIITTSEIFPKDDEYQKKLDDSFLERLNELSLLVNDFIQIKKPE